MNTKQTLAIFDLDNTLLAGDSDHAWGEFLISKREVEAQKYQTINDGFYQDYINGSLDIQAYLRFVLASIKDRTPAQLAPLHDQFMAEIVAPMRLQKADELLQRHRDKGDFLLIITATCDFITRPIAEALGVDDILASTAEIVDGVYTGLPVGVPCFHEGKITRLNQWLVGRNYDLSETSFYSDSHNDLPLLNKVGRPVAVDADAKLTRHANDRGWETMSLRG